MRSFLPKPTLNYAVLALYLLLPWIFFGAGIDVFHVPLAPGDGYISGLPTKIFATTLSSWNPYILSGTYAYKDIGFQALYPPALLVMSLFPNPFGYNLLVLIHYSFAGFFTYLLLRKMGLHVTAGFWGGLVYMFSGFMSAHLGHYMIVTTAMYLPIFLYCVESFFVTRRYLYLFFSTLAFASSLLADYAAVSMYIGMIGFAYIVFRVFFGDEFNQSRLLKKVFWMIGISLVTFLGGLILASVQVFPIVESLQYVSRQKISYEFFSSFSFPYKQIPMLIFPYAFGVFSPSFGYTIGYFGKWNLVELSGYMGILPLLLAILSVILFVKHEKQVLFWLLIAVGGFILVLGDSTPLYRFMYHIPGYNMFRAPARNWLEVNFSVAILSALFVHHIRTKEKIPHKVYLRAINAVPGVFFLFITVTLLAWHKLFPELLNTKWKEVVKLTSPAVFIPLLIFMTSCIFLCMLHHYKKRNFFWNALMIFVFLDLFSFGYVFNAKSYPNLSFFQNKPHAVFTYLNESNEDAYQYRILSLNFYGSEPELQPDLNMLYKISAANGYTNIWLNDYSRLTTFKADAIAGRQRDLVTNNAVLSVLSTKYLITSSEDQKEYIERVQAPGGEPASETLVGGLSSALGWEYISPASVTSAAITLQAQPKEMSLLQIPFEIQPNALYQVTLEARAAAGTASSPLVVDFFGKNYDKAGQEKAIAPSAISGAFRAYRFLISTEDRVPKSAHLRVFTYSEQPYEIRNVTLTRLESQDTYIPLWTSVSTGQTENLIYRPVYNSPDGITIYENRNSLPRARFVEQALPVDHWGDVFYYFWYAPGFNPAHTALVEGLDAELSGLSLGEILSETYENQKVTFRVRTDSAAFLVLADSWYPGWRVSLDGQETTLYKTYGMLRGVLIGAPGEHLVEFRFVPLFFYLGLVVTFTSTIVLFLAALALDRRKMT